MRSKRGLSKIPHCLEWYKLVPRTCLPTTAVRYFAVFIVQTSAAEAFLMHALTPIVEVLGGLHQEGDQSD